MAPRWNDQRLLIGHRRNRQFARWISWAGLLTVLLVVVFTYSIIEARTEPRTDSETTEVDSALGTTRSQDGDVQYSALSNAPRWGYLNYSRDFPEPIETPQLPIPEHHNISKFVRFFQGEGRETFVSSINRSWLHVPLMMEILKSYEIPAELVYMVLVESRFNNSAVSPQGAAGLWQLMPATARRLGLRVDNCVDERYDPVKSTHAAARYLRSLYDTAHSWHMAIAAYNVGVQPVLKLMQKRSGVDVWAEAGNGSLPGMTFVSKVYAAIVIARDLDGFGFERPRFIPLDGSDFVWVHSELSLRQVARWVGSTAEDLRELNPSLLSDRLPSGNEAFCLRLPSKTSPKFKLAYQRYLTTAKDG
jgi:membrane-bound lytic murein transglycosylase D